MLYKVPLWKVLEMKDKECTDLEILSELIKANKHKRVDKRLRVIKLHLEGKKQCEISEKLGYTPEWVCKLLKEYREKGLIEYARHKYGGNHRAMSVEEEEKILSQFEDESKSGKLVVANTIKKAFDEKRGKDTGRGYIYMLLKRSCQGQHTLKKQVTRHSPHGDERGGI
jgi:transposase